MRNIININSNWLFIKDTSDVNCNEGESISLPHTWNAIDGQDGGNDYFRGSCLYKKTLNKSELPESDLYYLEFRGTNSSADLFVNGNKIAHHDGGYSTWRANITEYIKDETEIAVIVDNSPNETVYPQMADFTFYGGIYRDVNLICVNNTHFDLDYYGGPGIMITPEVDEKNAKIEIEVFVKNLKESQKLAYTIYDAENKELNTLEANNSKVTLEIKDVILWHGRRNPYLYSCEVKIVEDGQIVDNIQSTFGCRSFKIDPDNGFILNGEEYPLRGVSRHQDRLGIGNALLPEHHKEDMDLICEVGATTIRLAHYQHDQYFYDLCDERGMVVWAEIPYISKHMPTGRENTISQMKELVIQNYNHPSIIVWGLSNEISIAGSDDDLLENHKILNDLVHDMDKTRLTTMAVVSMCKIDDPYIQIPDVISYNHYFGWYGGDTAMNGPWFDKFHAAHPKIPIGCSEYGCEALNWHTSNPKQGDYTEEYQAYYHEELIKQLFSRKYIWATHVWNMFDFGADARAEGGENGQNHKGLVTMDRKYKKDSFYAYKAWLSDDPFVHLCGKRYIDRVEDVTKVTVYSNLPEVELFVNGESIGKKTAEDHFFYFDVPNTGESKIVAKAGEFTDEGIIRKVAEPNMDYVLVEKGAVLNWFDIDAPEGRFSLNDTISDIMTSPFGKLWFMTVGLKLKKKMDAGKKNSGEKKSGGFDVDLKAGGGLMQMMGGFTVLRLTSMVGMMNISFTKEELLKMNKQLNRIRKPKK
ncbi:MAG: glycoside hydrolase family 2 TIM barrel-domain containing protein [Oscillospiraceae bacterium]|nr:glycoside hydrolase family 2 TIM barrel-domain containing protein [Oscillospiraceae bacterium]